MSWRTNGIVLALRNLGRSSGLNRWIAARTGSGTYEDRFQSRMLGEIRPNDCVWDVGANVGLYSSIFSRVVGPSGKVFAFEPSPTNFARLKSAIGLLDNVVLIPMALGESSGRMAFSEGSDATGATSRVVGEAAAPTESTVHVEVRRGDELILSNEADDPDVIKIDTEGFELDVIRGLEQTLRRPKLRALFIEIHFALLHDRGLTSAPAQIERELEACGFSCAWPDASHIVAIRSAA
jgi:FkbM family methyltransferase